MDFAARPTTMTYFIVTINGIVSVLHGEQYPLYTERLCTVVVIALPYMYIECHKVLGKNTLFSIEFHLINRSIRRM